MSSLSNKRILDKIYKNLSSVSKKSLAEQYSYFMIKVQIVELELKNLLIKKYSYNLEQMDKWTLGRIIKELEKNKLRPDFIDALNELLEYRNSMAHEFLGGVAVLKSIGPKFVRLQHKELRNALVQVEMIIQIYGFLSENDCL